MGTCKICGDDAGAKVYRFWSPDDGWEAGRLCAYCYEDAISRKPQPTDYAYDKRGELFADQDEAVSMIYG